RTIALRIGLLAAGLVFFNVAASLWSTGQIVIYPINLGLSIVVWVAGAGTTVLAFVRPLDRRWSWLILASALTLTFQAAYLGYQNYNPYNTFRPDNEMIAKYAVEALKHGQDPYSWNFGDLTRVYWNAGTLLTPFLDGSDQNRVTYPALPTLLLWGFDAL